MILLFHFLILLVCELFTQKKWRNSGFYAFSNFDLIAWTKYSNEVLSYKMWAILHFYPRIKSLILQIGIFEYHLLLICIVNRVSDEKAYLVLLSLLTNLCFLMYDWKLILQLQSACSTFNCEPVNLNKNKITPVKQFSGKPS